MQEMIADPAAPRLVRGAAKAAAVRSHIIGFMKPVLLTFLVLCSLSACATRGGHPSVTNDCVIPPSICQPTTGGGSGDAPPTCGLCPTEPLMAWFKQTGCDNSGNVACADGGTLYLDDHRYYCCTECPDECKPAASGG